MPKQKYLKDTEKARIDVLRDRGVSIYEKATTIRRSMNVVCNYIQKRRTLRHQTANKRQQRDYQSSAKSTSSACGNWRTRWDSNDSNFRPPNQKTSSLQHSKYIWPLCLLKTNEDSSSYSWAWRIAIEMGEKVHELVNRMGKCDLQWRKKVQS